MKTFNRRITEGIHDGTIKEVEFCGVRVYKVVRPAPDEEVVGHVNFSSFLVKSSPTESALV